MKYWLDVWYMAACGTCITRVLDETPDHRDQDLTDAERVAGDQMTICCSRAPGDRLVLDL